MTTVAGTRTTPAELVMGRPEYEIDLRSTMEVLATHSLLVTGGAGSIGAGVRALLEPAGIDHWVTDKDNLDVTDAALVTEALAEMRPSLVLHLAGAKHAPWGEENPSETIRTNIAGTANVLRAARLAGARVVTASTCKACDPETVYGASKLLAERLTLDTGGTVARFFNVVETCGNVFRTWEGLGEHDAVPVTPCARYFITLREAAALVLVAATLPSGRYAVNPGRRPRMMPTVAAALYPDRAQQMIPVRRGDRISEPMHAHSEHVSPLNEWLWRVVSSHDRAEAT